MRPSTLVLAALLASGCANLITPRPVPIDPGANFGAHAVRGGGVAIDRLPGDGRRTLERAALLSGWTSPTFVLTGGADGGSSGLWVKSTAAVDVHAGRERTAPAVGSIDPQWEDNSIRLTLRPAEGDSLTTDLFARQVTGGGPSTLSRRAETVLEERGAYRAVVRDPKGADVGWNRVRIGPYEPAPRIYDGVLPPSVGPELAAAVAVALDGEVQWIEDHTLDVYRGSGSGGPLGASIPLK